MQQGAPLTENKNFSVKVNFWWPSLKENALSYWSVGLPGVTARLRPGRIPLSLLGELALIFDNPSFGLAGLC